MTETETGAYREDEKLAKFIHGHSDVRAAVQAVGYTPEILMRDVARAVAGAIHEFIGVREQKQVTYLYPGILFAESDTLPIEDGPRLPERAAEQAPKSAYSFSIKSVLVADPIEDGHGGQLRVMSRVLTKSGNYFLGGELFTAEQVTALDDGQDYTILLSNMRSNGHAQVVRTPLGNWVPFEDGDVLLPLPERQS